MNNASYTNLAVEHDSLLSGYGNLCYTLETMMAEFEKLERMKQEYLVRISNIKHEINNYDFTEPKGYTEPGRYSPRPPFGPGEKPFDPSKMDGFMDPSDDDDHHTAFEENQSMPLRGNAIRP